MMGLKPRTSIQNALLATEPNSPDPIFHFFKVNFTTLHAIKYTYFRSTEPQMAPRVKEFAAMPYALSPNPRTYMMRGEATHMSCILNFTQVVPPPCKLTN